MRALSFVIGFSVIAAVHSLAAQTIEPELLNEVRELSARLSDGIATFDSAEAKGSDTRVFVVFGMTSWGGGNGSRQFLAVFERQDGTLNGQPLKPYRLEAVVQIGSGFDRWFSTFEVRDDRAELYGRRWAPKDAHCCPTLDERATYRFSDRGLGEVR